MKLSPQWHRRATGSRRTEVRAAVSIASALAVAASLFAGAAAATPAGDPAPARADGAVRQGGLVLPATKNSTSATALSCAAGDFYTITSGGAVRKVTSNDNTPNAETASASIDFPGASANFNGLAIGARGETAYAFDRNYGDGGVAIYKWTSAGGTPTAPVWSGSLPWKSGLDRGSLIAGGVSPTDSTGAYYFGGYTVTGNGGRPSTSTVRFQLFRFDGSTVDYLGYVPVTSSATASGANGDLAFDSNGNLYVLYNDGAGHSRILPITAAELAAANGGQIVAGTTATLSSQGGGAQYNGLAFNSTGAAFVQYSGDGTHVGAINPDTGDYVSNPQTVALSGMPDVGVDLASCQTPPTFQKLQKDIEGRAVGTDQFTLTITREGADQPSATGETTGTDDGLQTGAGEFAGPIVAEAGATYVLEEVGSGTPAADLSNYTSSLACVDTANGNAPIATTPVDGSTTKYTVTVPADRASAIECTFTNAGSKPAWTLAKSSNPKSGTQVAPGDTITYTVKATGDPKLATEDVVLTDDLSDVLDDAAFVSGSAKLTIGSGEAQDVSDPTGTTLTTSSFTLPAGTDATLTYRVKVDADAWNATLKNVATGNGSTPPEQCETGKTPVASDCQTTHTTGSLLYIQKLGPTSSASPSSSPSPLDGSNFQILADDGGQPGDPVTGHQPSAVSGKTGLFQVSGLPAGTYWLKETASPVGYDPLAQPVEFVVAEDGTVTLPGSPDGVKVATDKDSKISTISVSDSQKPAVALPRTGGTGDAPYIAGGLGVLAAAGGLAYLLARRRKAAGAGAHIALGKEEH